MKEKHNIFLNNAEVLNAVRMDLEQYRPQPILIRQLAYLILHENAVILQDKHGVGLWVAMGGQKNFRLISYDKLPQFLCSLMEDIPPPLEKLAKICGCVFQELAYPGIQAGSGERGVFIETGMELFQCRQCGQCCQLLDYHRELTLEDYQLWQKLGRNDILDRVGVIRRRGEITGFRIWIDPVTHHVIKGCPWLVRDSVHNRYVCRIHDVRPGICRQYPGSRKHARMTGCRAFDRC